MERIPIQILLCQDQFYLLFGLKGYLCVHGDGDTDSSTRLRPCRLLNFLVPLRVEDDADRPGPLPFHPVAALALVDLTMSLRVQNG